MNKIMAEHLSSLLRRFYGYTLRPVTRQKHRVLVQGRGSQLTIFIFLAFTEMLPKSKVKVHTQEIIEQQQQNKLRLNQVISNFTKVSPVTLHLFLLVLKQ